MAEEQKADDAKGKGKVTPGKETTENKTVADSSKVVPTQQQKQDVDPKQIDAMLKMLGLSNNTITPQTVCHNGAFWSSLTSSKKAKDMNSHKFWQTQPVQSFG